MILVAFAHASTAEWHLAQARQFKKRGWWTDVATELEAAEAAGLPDVHAAWWTAAELHYELCQASSALTATNRAVVLAPDDAAREQALNLATLLQQGWGRVALSPPGQPLVAPLKVVRVSPQVDPELDRLTTQCQARWSRGVALPGPLDLPVGDWTINGDPVSVRVSEPASLMIRRVGSASLQHTTLAFGGGLGLFGGDELLLEPTLRVLLDAPLGPVDLGLGAVWSPPAWETPTGTAWGFDTWALDLRLGHNFAFGEELDLVPWIGVRAGQLRGVARACTLDGACDTPDGTEPEAWVYPPSWTVAPLAALSVRWTPPAARFGVGLELMAQHHFGWLPTTGTADFADREGSFSYTEAAPAWRAFGGSAVVDLVFSL